MITFFVFTSLCLIAFSVKFWVRAFETEKDDFTSIVFYVIVFYVLAFFSTFSLAIQINYLFVSDTNKLPYKSTQMINYPFTLYNNADSETLLNAQQAALDAIPYSATMVRLDVQSFAVAPVPDDLAAEFSAADYAKKLVMITIAHDVMTSNTTSDYNTAYHLIYDELYP